MATMTQSDNCSICKPKDQQTKVILFGLFVSLRKYRERASEQIITDFGGLSRLLKTVFSPKFKAFRDTMNCSHDELKNLIKQKLKISESDLDKLANRKVLEYAKYNFHADVVSLQIKSFPRHFTNISSGLLAEKAKNNEKNPEGIPSYKHARTKSSSPPNYKQFPSIKTLNSPLKEQIKMEDVNIPIQQQFPKNFKIGGQVISPPVKHQEYPFPPPMPPMGQFMPGLQFGNEYNHMMNHMMMMDYGFMPPPHYQPPFQ